MRKKILSSFVILLLSSAACAQGVGVNSSGNPPDPSAILDATSTTKGQLMPRMTTAQRDAIPSPANGLMIWNTTTNCLDVYIVNLWQSLSCGCSSAPASPGSITGSTTPCANSIGNVYSISAVFSASSYTWTVPSDATITAGQGTPSITVTFGNSSGNVSVMAVNVCGASPSTSLSITLGSAPATPGAISGTQYPCVNSTGNVYSISAVSNTTTYNWTVPSGATITSGAGTTSITVSFGSTFGNISVTASNVCGASSARTYSVAQGVCATGGTVSVVGGYKIHTFTSPGTFTPTGSGTVEVLLVAGGGGGGSEVGGGGGAGGLIYDAAFAVTVQAYPVTIGPGGSGGIYTSNNGSGTWGSNGGNSSFSTYTAIGGGGGGPYRQGTTVNQAAGIGGGSGGGGGPSEGASTIQSGGAGTSGQGNAGGAGGFVTTYVGGGGGGAGATGQAGYAGHSGNGGNGLSYSISGTSAYYSGGGGGGGYSSTIPGSGGLGGGGAGGDDTHVASNGLANTGGGGGGSQDNVSSASVGGNGGSGIVIIRYPN